MLAVARLSLTKVCCAIKTHNDAIIIVMRTTVNLPDDVYELARSHAHARRISLGEAIAELMRERSRPPLEIVTDNGFPHFRVPPGTPKLSLEEALAMEAQAELEDDLHKAGF